MGAKDRARTKLFFTIRAIRGGDSSSRIMRWSSRSVRLTRTACSHAQEADAASFGWLGANDCLLMRMLIKVRLRWPTTQTAATSNPGPRRLDDYGWAAAGILVKAGKGGEPFAARQERLRQRRRLENQRRV